MPDDPVRFKMTPLAAICECGEFELNLLTDHLQQALLDHARTHNPTSANVSVTLYTEGSIKE